MKLFFWNKPYPVAYGGSMLFAVAETEEEAREIVTNSAGYFSYGTADKHDPGYPSGLTAKLGAPRVVDLPCAEFHQWSE